MSQETALRFLTFVQEKPEIQEEIAQLRGPNALDKLLEIAEAQGFLFDKEAYRAAVVEMSEGALSDEAIEETAQAMGLQKRESKP